MSKHIGVARIFDWGRGAKRILYYRAGVLEDVLGLEDVLEDTFWSPWPWPRSLKSSKTSLSSARGQHYFLNSWNFVRKHQKPRRKFANTFFVFLNWSIGVSRRGQGARPPNWNFTDNKNVTKKLIVSSVSVSFWHFSLTTVTNNNLKNRGPGPPSIQFLPANLNVQPGRNGEKIAISGPHLAFLWT